MTQEYIVNRVSQTPYQQIEEAKLKAEPVWVVDPAIEVPVQGNTEYQVRHDADGIYQVPDHVGDTVKILPPVESEQKDGTPAPEIVEDLNGEQRIPESVIGSIDYTALREVLRGSNVSGFRKQVIAAFKHLGLDTKKFFGE